jgi:hypothetical protein
VLRAVLALVIAAALVGCGSRDTGEVEPVSATSPTLAPAPAAPSTDQLPGLVVGLADLPDGFSIREEGVIPASGTVVGAYRRSFDSGNARLGESALAELASDMALFESPQAAAAALANILGGLLDDDVSESFADLVDVYTGIEARNLQGQTLATRTLGDSAVVSRATFDTDAGRAEAVFVVVLVGPLQHALFLLGPAGSVQIEDATDLARSVVPRMRTAAEGGIAA